MTFTVKASHILDGVAFIFRMHGTGDDAVLLFILAGAYLGDAGQYLTQIPDCTCASLIFLSMP